MKKILNWIYRIFSPKVTVFRGMDMYNVTESTAEESIFGFDLFSRKKKHK